MLEGKKLGYYGIDQGRGVIGISVFLEILMIGSLIILNNFLLDS